MHRFTRDRLSEARAVGHHARVCKRASAPIVKSELESRLSADLAIFGSALLWGTLWIPLRRLHELGADGVWASTLGFLMPVALLLPLALRRRLADRETLLSGFLLAAAIALYSAGVVRGPVARVVLLFYLTPLWSTLIARWALHQPITNHRIATLALAFAGLVTVLGQGGTLPLPRQPADWMGLVAGISWAVAMLFVRRTASQPTSTRVLAQFVFLAPLFLGLSLLFPLAPNPSPAGLEVDRLVAATPWLIAFALVWMLPVVWLTVHGASRIEPGRVAIFLMLEIAVALVSAALLAGEVVGPREILGAGLIVGASAVELLSKPESQHG
jgi:drug/metabolite transporter (DMT)-like permease